MNQNLIEKNNILIQIHVFIKIKNNYALAIINHHNNYNHLITSTTTHKTQQNRFTPAHAKPRQFSPSQNFRPRAPALINPADPPPYTRPFALAFRCGSTGPTARPAPSATCPPLQLGRPGSSAPPRPAYELSGLWLILILYYILLN